MRHVHPEGPGGAGLQARTEDLLPAAPGGSGRGGVGPYAAWLPGTRTSVFTGPNTILLNQHHLLQRPLWPLSRRQIHFGVFFLRLFSGLRPEGEVAQRHLLRSPDEAGRSPGHLHLHRIDVSSARW